MIQPTRNVTKNISEPPYRTAPEVELWISVLQRAIDDFQGDIAMPPKNGRDISGAK